MRSGLSLTLALAAALPAEAQQDPFRFVPPNAAIVARTKGFAGWRQDFAATGVGKVFGDAQLAASARALWQSAVDDFVGDDSLDEATVAKWDAVIDAFAGHAGDVVFGLSVDLTPLKHEQPPHLLASLAIFADGKTDLDAIEKAIRAAMPGDRREREIGGESVSFHTLAYGELAGPTRRGDALVVLFGNDLATHAASVLEAHERGFELEPDMANATLGLQAEVAPSMAALRATLDAVDVPEAGRIARVLDATGLTSWQRITLSLRANGTHAEESFALALGEGPRGVLDVFAPTPATEPTMLEYLPPDATCWSFGRFDATAFLRAIVEVVAATEGADRQAVETTVEEKVREFTKLRIRDDVLVHLGNEYLRIDDIQAMAEGSADEPDEDAERFSDRFGDTCFAVRLRDGEALARSLETALRARGMHAARKTEAYGDHKIHGIKLAGSIPVEYAFVDDLLVVGIGGRESTKRAFRGLLDTVAARRRGERAPDLPEAVRAKIQGWAPNWSAISTTDVAEMMDGLVGMVAPALAYLEEESPWHEVPRFVQRLGAVVAAHGIRHLVAAQWHEPRRFTAIVRW